MGKYLVILNDEGPMAVKADESKDDLVNLQEAVGGYIEPIVTPDRIERGNGYISYVNENGLFTEGLKRNQIGEILFGYKTIYGNIVICKGDTPNTYFDSQEALEVMSIIHDYEKKIRKNPTAYVGLFGRQTK